MSDSGGFFGWLGGLFGGGGGGGGTITDPSSQSMWTGAPSETEQMMWAMNPTMTGTPLTNPDTGQISTTGGNATWNSAGGLGQAASALKNLSGIGGQQQGQQPQQQNLTGAPAKPAMGRSGTLDPLVQVLLARQNALYQAQAQGAPPPINRTLGLLGF